MKKIILSTGVNGTYAGTVEVILNDRNHPKQHHRVIAEGHGFVYESAYWEDDMRILSLAAVVEKNLKKHLDQLSKEEHPVTARDLLVRQGYM